MLFGLGVVLARFAEQPSATTALMRPLVVVLVLSAVVSVLALLIVRDRTWAPIVASFVVLVMLREPVLAGIYLAIVVWWVAISRIRRLTRRKPPPRRIPEFAARAGGYMSVAYLAVMTISAAQATGVAPPVVHMPEYRVEGTGGPNIYLIMLDGYPRADTLRNDFEYDNSAFIGRLAGMGFDVSTDSRSNYNKTWLTYASMLNGAYVSDLLGDQPIPPDDATHIRWLLSLMNRGALLDVARQRGYEITSVPPPIVTAAPTAVDHYDDGGMVTEFEAKLISETPFARLLREPLNAFLLGSQKSAVMGALERTAQISESHPESPQLVLTQVESPHPPFALADFAESAAAVPSCFPQMCSFWHATTEEIGISVEEYGDLLRQQVEALNARALEAVERVIAADPTAIVLLWSDHGLRYSLSNREEHFRSFLAARTPGAEVLLRDQSPVNFLRLIFAHYLGVNSPALPYRSWFSDWDYTLRLTAWPPGTTGTEGDCSLALKDFEGVPLESPYRVLMVAEELGGEATAEIQYVAEGWGATTVETVDPDGARNSTLLSSDFNDDVEISLFDRPGVWQVRVTDPEGCEAAFSIEVAPPLS
jgi:hypothetical protein